MRLDGGEKLVEIIPVPFPQWIVAQSTADPNDFYAYRVHYHMFYMYRYSAPDGAGGCQSLQATPANMTDALISYEHIENAIGVFDADTEEQAIQLARDRVRADREAAKAHSGEG